MAQSQDADSTWADFDFVQNKREQKDEVDSAWNDFDYEQKMTEQKEEDKKKEETKVENEYEDDFETEEKTDSYEDASKKDDSVSSPRHASSEKLDEADGDRKERKSRKKHKHKPRKAQHHHEPSGKPPPLNLYQDHARKLITHTRERTSPRSADVMSDQENIRRGRRLQRRGQIRKFRSMEVAVEQAGKDRLEQKYQELEELMTRPLADTRGVHIPQQRIHKMVAMQQKHASVGHRSAYPQRHDNGAIGPWFGDTVQEEEGENDDNAYSTIRVLQTTGPDLHMQVRYENNSGPRPGSARHRDGNSPRNNTRESRQENKLSAKPPRPRRRKGSVDSSPTSSSGASQHRQEEDRQNDNSAGRYSYDDDRFDDDNTSPRRVYLSNEMHLKYSDNPKLQEWLKRKNAEYRRQKKAERAKKREERNDKMVEQEQKIARREKSSERVKEWMDMKRKEAAIRNKEERRRKKQQARQEAAHRASRSPSGGVMGKRIDRPASAPASCDKKHIPIKRPESAVRLDNGDGTVPKPPDSKFVYKRPVSGRVKLMKLQNERNSRARSADQQRYEALSPEEKEKRARLSYDAWLVAKRKEDQQKKKEAQKQKDLIKSDPEMERIIPELAKKRIERIKSGKKRIDTGMQNIDNAANTSFGGGDFDQESPEAIQEGHPPNDNVPRPSSYKLAVDGAAASLAEVNTRARPVSAKTRMPIPQSALSPRRPKSATPKVKAVMDKDQSDEPNPYKLPFPDHMGVPEQVKRVQEKIFSPHLIASANSERPEPQGCASVETGGCPKGVDGVHSEPPPRASLVLLQEIEAAAVKSEKEAQSLEALEEQATAVETDSKMETPPVEPSDEAAPEETHEELKELQKHLDENEEGTGQKIQSRGIDDDDDDDVGYEEEEDDDDEVVEVERTEDQQEKIPSPAYDEELQQASAEPLSADTDQSGTDVQNGDSPDPQKSGDTEEQQNSADPQSDKEDEFEKDISDADTENALSKSINKHVSFSEEAPTVFKMDGPPDSQTSSIDFDDERGSDDKDDESQYVSLDDAPE